jgi:hypothetical protein
MLLLGFHWKLWLVWVMVFLIRCIALGYGLVYTYTTAVTLVSNIKYF